MANIQIDFSMTVGKMKPLHGVNSGPKTKVFTYNATDMFLEAGFPFSRLHDVEYPYGSGEFVDIHCVFPDFDADENDPASYNFGLTDLYIEAIREAKTDVIYRLGESIEHAPVKRHIYPPKDFAKWAHIAEHIIRHYNEGWGWGVDKSYTTRNIAWSNQFNIVYWEIWNEPDLDVVETGQPKNPRCWGGSVTNFFEFYETAAKHLKAKFPKLKIGGPALAYNENWADRFLAYCRDKSVPLDFFSWHIYARNPSPIVEKAARMRKMMDKYGFRKSESILNEWNYVKGWVDDWVYSLRCESGDMNLKGAAFIASTMIACQDTSIDMLMFYDARISTTMNNMFARVTLWPLRGYYPFYIWSKLRDLGTQVETSVVEGKGAHSDANTGFVEKRDVSRSGQFSAVAAKGADGSLGVFVSRYSDDDNVSDTGSVIVRVKGVKISKARCLMTDIVRANTEMPLEVLPDGSVKFAMQPRSFVYVIFE